MQIDWRSKQQAVPVCRVTAAYLERRCPAHFRCDVLTEMVHLFGKQIALTNGEVIDQASRATLLEVSHDVSKFLLLHGTRSTRKKGLPTSHDARIPGDESTGFLFR